MLKKRSFSERNKKDFVLDQEKKEQGEEKTQIKWAAIIKNNTNCYPQTGSWKFACPEINSNKCIGCGICSQLCPENVIFLNKKNKAQIELNFCKGCGICQEVCPIKAISMKFIF